MELTVKIAQTKQDCERIAQLAEEIWGEHYHDILSAEQSTYMLQKYQSAPAVYDAICTDHTYFMAYDGDQAIGYVGIQYEEDSVFLSKFYILRAYRGQGVGKELFRHVLEKSEESNAAYIWLTVNRQNVHSVEVYRKLGFTIDREEVDDIGDGFVKDDYIMKYQLK